MTIRNKLYLLLSFLVVCFGILHFITARQATYIKDDYIRLTEQTFPTNDALMDIKASLLRIISSTNELGVIVAFKDPSELKGNYSDPLAIGSFGTASPVR